MIRNLFHLCLLFVLVSCNQEQPGPAGSSAPEVGPTVTVKTVTLEKGSIAATIIAYGSVSVLPKELEVVSVQYESLVNRMLVSAGEPVNPGTPLIEIEPSPDAQLQFSEAQSASDSAAEQLADVQRRFDLKLAVNVELQQAKQSARDSKARVDSLLKRGEGSKSTVKADEPGVVDTIPVSVGQVVPAGTPLLSIVPQNQIEIRLGVEPENADSFGKDAKVKIFSVNRDDIQSEGTVRLVTRRVNPQTRLVDVYVSVAPPSPLLLESYVRAEIQAPVANGLILPREAVISKESGEIIFTVREGKAVEHRVTTGIETETQIEVVSDTLSPSDEIVTVGNTQLSDGMAVTVAN